MLFKTYKSKVNKTYVGYTKDLKERLKDKELIINSLGTYYHPKVVYISEEILKKIPFREYNSGIPEIIKYGLIKNANKSKRT